MKKFTHIDKEGKARMVDVSEKAATMREAVSKGFCIDETGYRTADPGEKRPQGRCGRNRKDSRHYGCKEDGELIPMCHPLNLTSVAVEITVEEEKNRVRIEARAKTVGQTGVEMEALTAVSVAALTIYDMCKAVDREMSISDIVLVEKRGGKSGEFRRKD